MNDSKTEVKLKLKNPLIGYNNKPIKNLDNVIIIARKYPQLSNLELLEKLPNLTFGDILPKILLEIQTPDSKDKLKLFRWASKIEDKLITQKGELVLDLNQITELYDFITKSTTISTNTYVPIISEFERLKEELSK